MEPFQYIATLFRPTGDHPTWSESEYSPEYAGRFAANIRIWDPGARVTIVTDYPADDFLPEWGLDIVPIRQETGWAALIEMFRPDVIDPCGGHALLCGLDTVFVGPLDEIKAAVRTHGWIATRDPIEADVITNAVLGVSWDNAVEFWDRWISRRDAALSDASLMMFGKFSEMKWMRRDLPAPRLFEDVVGSGAVVSYRECVKRHDGGIPRADARIVYFHGPPKPSELADDPKKHMAQWLTAVWGPEASDLKAKAEFAGRAMAGLPGRIDAEMSGDPAWDAARHEAAVEITPHPGMPIVERLGDVARLQGWTVLDVESGGKEFAKRLRDRFGLSAFSVNRHHPDADSQACALDDVADKYAGEPVDVVCCFRPGPIDPDEWAQIRELAPRFIVGAMDEGDRLMARDVGANFVEYNGFITGTWSENVDPSFLHRQADMTKVDAVVIASAIYAGTDLVPKADDPKVVMCGRNVDPSVLSQWASGMAREGITRIGFRVEGNNMPMDVIHRMQRIVEMAIGDVGTGAAIADLMRQNAVANGKRIFDRMNRARFDGVYRAAVPPGRPGGIVIVVGAGPSMDPEHLGRVMDAVDHRDDVMLYVVDRCAGMIEADAYVTLEPRPVKLETMATRALRHGSTMISSVFACPDRIPDIDVADTCWLQQALAVHLPVPGWVVEIPPPRQVGALAVYAAMLTRPSAIVLYGMDCACGPDDERYGNGMEHQEGEIDHGMHPETVPSLDGGRVRTMPNYVLAIHEYTMIASNLATYGTAFLNATTRGAHIEGWARTTLEKELGLE